MFVTRYGIIIDNDELLLVHMQYTSYIYIYIYISVISLSPLIVIYEVIIFLLFSYTSQYSRLVSN
jgi:hypothetical protein